MPRALLEAAARSYATCPVALSADLQVPPFFWRVPLDEAEERFARLELGVWCGANAWHLVQVLTARRAEAYTYDHGNDGRSHVIVLARLDGSLVALDPYLGHYLADARGRPMPFVRHLDALRHDRPGGSWTRLPGLGRKTLLVRDAGTVAPSTRAWLEVGTAVVRGHRDGRLVLEQAPPPPFPEFCGAAEARLDLLRPRSIADGTGQSTPPPEAVLQELGLGQLG